MKLFLVFITIFFLCLMMGSENKQVMGQDTTCTEVIAHQTQIGVDFSENVVSPGWLRSYLFILNVLDPVKQLDLPSDHEKNSHTLQGKILRSVRNTAFSIHRQACYDLKYYRLLSARYINGFYIYSLEKLLI